MKTNAARKLDSLGIIYELRDYVVDPENLEAEAVAEKLKLPVAQVFKTLMVRGDRTGPLFAVLPGNMRVHLKSLAQLSGNRKIEMVPLKDVQPMTGYIRGGVTALASKKTYPVYLDEAAHAFASISISAGVRGTQILLAPTDYTRAVDAVVGLISEEKS